MAQIKDILRGLKLCNHAEGFELKARNFRQTYKLMLTPIGLVPITIGVGDSVYTCVTA
jgi:hypothetical protein